MVRVNHWQSPSRCILHISFWKIARWICMYLPCLNNQKHNMSASRNTCFKMIKCSDSSCCKPWRANYPIFFPKQILPAPVPISISDNGLKIDSKRSSFRSLFQSFYLVTTLKLDFTCYVEYCPSLQRKKYQKWKSYRSTHMQ